MIVGLNAGGPLPPTDRSDIVRLGVATRTALDVPTRESVRLVLSTLVGLRMPLVVLHGQAMSTTAIAAHAVDVYGLARGEGLAAFDIEPQNEPDLADMPPGAMGERCLAVREALRGAGFTGRIYGGCPSNLHSKGVAYLKAMRWDTLPADLLSSAHWYAKDNKPGVGHHGPLSEDLARAQDACAGRMPIITETGYHNALMGWWIFKRRLEDPRRATAIERDLMTMAACGVDRADVYQINCGPSAAYIDHFGIRDETNARRWLQPAYAVQRVAQRMNP